jgi:hypothetical protein
VSLSQMLSDVKEWFDRGSQLAETHIPALVEWAGKAEADPLIQEAIDVVLPASTREMLAGLIKSVEADVKSVEEGAAAAAAQAAAEPADAAAAPADPAAPAA